MKKIILVTALMGLAVALSLSVIVPDAFAQLGPANPSSGGGLAPGAPSNGDSIIRNPLKATSIQCLVVNILNLVSSIGAIIVALMIIYTGYKFVMARGNQNEITDAKRALLYTLIGALILLGAVVIANVVAGTLNQVLQSGTSVPTLNTNVCS